MGRRKAGVVTATITIPAWMKRELVKLAEKKFTNLSALAREALVVYLEKQGIKRPQ